MVDMDIQLPVSGDHDLLLSYITESPAWKPSYRLVVGADGSVNVQGWAIVDNTSGEDWNAVRLGVGSSSALSFRYDLRTVRNVHRETLQSNQQFAQAPPRGGAVHGGSTPRDNPVLYELADAQIPRPQGHPDSPDVELSTRDEFSTAQGVTRPPASPASVRDPQADARVAQLASQLNARDGNVVIEGYAAAGERDGRRRSLDRANLLRNRLIREGVAPARLVVRGRGVVEDRGAGARVVASNEPVASGTESNSSASGSSEPIGESHFESNSTMTVARGTSAMVSILDGAAEGEIVYYYAPDAERGDERFAFKTVRFTNPTDSTLETGPVTVYGDGRFIGEGLSEPIPPRSTAFIPFALDRQIMVDRSRSTGDRISRMLTVQRGVLTAEFQHLRTTELEITSRSTANATVYVRHLVRSGWEVQKSPELHEKQGEFHIYRVDIPAGQTRMIAIEEATPLTRTIDMRSTEGVEMVRLFLQTSPGDPRFEEPVRALLALHAQTVDLGEAIESNRDRLEDYRVRIDELHGQILKLQSARAGGTRLMRHLRDKMQEMSERLQAGTIVIVDLQQQLMLARVRFQDGVSEFTLEQQSAQRAEGSET
jgi:hypothetical protein